MTLASLRWVTGALCLLTAIAWLARSNYPPLPSTLELRLTLPRENTGTCAPLITTGQTDAGTLLYVRYTGPETVVLGYDSWAVGGPESPEIRIVPGQAEELRVSLPGFTAPTRVDRKARGRLLVVHAGRTVLDSEVHYHGRTPDAVHFGENPIGGSITNTRFKVGSQRWPARSCVGDRMRSSAFTSGSSAGWRLIQRLCFSPSLAPQWSAGCCR